jgi:ATP-binding cassette subfamily F protein 3
VLGSFLFSADDVFKRIGVLSGGERNRYALARMLLMPSNFLLLDEPTNHLDMRAKDVLLAALQEFNGTVVFVSHDRYFIDKLATRVIEVAEGEVTVYPGNYEDYLWRKQGNAPTPASKPVAAVPKTEAQNSTKGKDGKLNPIKLHLMKERRRELEEQVTRIEGEIAEYERALANFTSAEKTMRTSELLGARRADLETLMAEWEQVSQTIEANR